MVVVGGGIAKGLREQTLKPTFLGLPLTGCVIFGMLMTLFVSQIPHLVN